MITIAINYEQVATTPDRIREALKLRNMKQSDLAKLSGISKQSINSYVCGRYEPKQTALYKMGKALDVAEMWLAGYDIPMERPATQRENDALVDLVDKLENEKDFRSLVLRISNLKPEQLQAVKNLIDVFYAE